MIMGSRIKSGMTSLEIMAFLTRQPRIDGIFDTISRGSEALNFLAFAFP